MDNHNYRTCRSTNFVREFDNEENEHWIKRVLKRVK